MGLSVAPLQLLLAAGAGGEQQLQRRHREPHRSGLGAAGTLLARAMQQRPPSAPVCAGAGTRRRRKTAAAAQLGAELDYRTAARTLFLRPYLAHFCPVFSRFFAVFSVLTPGFQKVAPKDRGAVP